MPRNVTGKPVQGEDCFGRAREMARLWERLDTDNVLLLAPRRVGKTSLMYRLRDHASEHECLAVYASVADVTTEIGFVRKLYEQIQGLAPAKGMLEKLSKGPVKHAFRKIRKLGVLGVSIELAESAEQHWAQVGQALTSALGQLDGKCLVLIDELPIFVLSMLREDPSGQRARAFLNWFRQCRIDPQAQSVRWLLAGSIGLDTVARRMGFGDTINDLCLFDNFGAFSDKVATAFLHALGQRYGLPISTALAQHACARVGWLIPYHLQLLFSEIRNAVEPGSAPSVETIDRAYQRLLSLGKRAYFDYWKHRLKEELGVPESGYALDLLNAACADPAGATSQTLGSLLYTQVTDSGRREDILAFLLDVLQSDGYLIQENGRYRFRSALLREFWQQGIVP